MSQDARLDEELVTQRRAEVLGFDYVDTSKIQKQLFQSILTVKELYDLKLVPLVADEHNLHFGILTTTSQQSINRLKQRFTDYRLYFSMISETGYNEYMKLYDPPKKVEYQSISISPQGSQSQDMISDVSHTLTQVKADDMLAYLVQQAYKLKSSDIHLENQRDNVRIRFRVDGVLHPIATVEKDKFRHLVSAIASASGVSTNSKDAQTGHISNEYKMATGDEVTLNLRVETIPTVYGMDIVMRLFNMQLEYFKLENLGLDSREFEVVQDVIKHPTGLVLVVGPTGSGKTTTLYSIINSLNTTERKIITLEDPVEYNIPGVIQIPVEGQMEGHDFAERLRAVLRLDPNVIMIGEIRDQDTAKTALQASLTGHLVLSTFHADNSAAALTRMLDMVGINPLFADAMHLIMAQRLVRRLDDETKQPYQPDEALKKQLSLIIDSFPPNVPKPDINSITLYKPGSSPKNPFGFSGQIALREQLLMTSTIREVLRLPPNQITTELLHHKAIEGGMRTMLQDGLQKAMDGKTTLEEIYRAVG